MIKRLSNPDAMSINWLIIVRVITGIIIAKYGFEMFDGKYMKGSVQWLTDIHFPLPVVMAYVGKAAELVGGTFLILGLLTRLWCFILIIEMIIIITVLGHSKIFGDEQLPFLLMLLFLSFFFTGAGKWSLDRLIYNKQIKKP